MAFGTYRGSVTRGNGNGNWDRERNWIALRFRGYSTQLVFGVRNRVILRCRYRQQFLAARRTLDHKRAAVMTNLSFVIAGLNRYRTPAPPRQDSKPPRSSMPIPRHCARTKRSDRSVTGITRSSLSGLLAFASLLLGCGTSAPRGLGEKIPLEVKPVQYKRLFDAVPSKQRDNMFAIAQVDLATLINRLTSQEKPLDALWGLLAPGQKVEGWIVQVKSMAFFENGLVDSNTGDVSPGSLFRYVCVPRGGERIGGTFAWREL
jgi:hypothetical protein